MAFKLIDGKLYKDGSMVNLVCSVISLTNDGYITTNHGSGGLTIKNGKVHMLCGDGQYQQIEL